LFEESPVCAPLSGPVALHAADPPGRCGPLPLALSAYPHSARRRNPLSAQTTSPVSGPPDQAPACYRCPPPRLGLAGALVRLAAGLSHGATGDLYPLASAGIPAVLALEV